MQKGVFMMENLSKISVVKKVLEKHGFSFSKGLGQNFLINPSVCPKMAEMGNAKPGWGILEIGAGVGVLTAELARRADKVVCVEIDSRLIPVLGETLEEFKNIKLVNEDILKVDLQALISEEFPNMPVAVCANLPYYISSPIIMLVLESKLPVESLTVMVQKEAAQRMCATPGSREGGAVSIAIQYYASPKVLFQVSRGSFMPAPEVDSTVIQLQIRKEPPVTVNDEKTFFKVVKGAFSQRRKTLHNTLSSFFSIPKSEMLVLLEKAGVNPGLRAEQLSMQQFADIANHMCASSTQ